MSYKKLKNFKDILKDDDFDYICNHDNIYKSPLSISKIIIYKISEPDGKEQTYIRIFQEFLKKFNSFYETIEGENITDIKVGYLTVKKELERCIALFSEPNVKRMSISKHSIKQFNKRFLHGLSKLLSGIRASFDPELILSTNIKNEQYIRYFKDKKEGLGKKFKYNERGKDSFLKKSDIMTIDELSCAHRLLIKPNRRQVRSVYVGWKELGSKKDIVRIIAKGNIICFLYRLSEHRSFKNQLNIPPKKTKLSLY